MQVFLESFRKVVLHKEFTSNFRMIEIESVFRGRWESQGVEFKNVEKIWVLALEPELGFLNHVLH